MRGIIKILLDSVAVFFTAYLLPGITVDRYIDAVLVAVVLAIVNIIIKPILTVLTLPITVLTFGLFAFVINALLVLLVDFLIPGFEVANFWWALLFSLVFSLISYALHTLIKD